MEVNAGPYVSWGLYRASNMPVAIIRWWIDGPPAGKPVIGALTISVLPRLTTAKAHVITRGVAMGRVVKVTLILGKHKSIDGG
jgi:hypothetical protein